MSDTLRKEPKTRTIKLGETEYELPQLNLNMLTEIEEQFDCSISDLGEALQKRHAGALRKLLFALLGKKYDITEDAIGEMVNMNNLESVSNQVAEALSGE